MTGMLFYGALIYTPFYQLFQGKGESARSLVTIRDVYSNAVYGSYIIPDEL